MKTIVYVVVVTAVLIGTTINALSQDASDLVDVAQFEIVVSVDTASNGVNLYCMEGCAWQTLSFSCEPGAECASAINGLGMIRK